MKNILFKQKKTKIKLPAEEGKAREGKAEGEGVGEAGKREDKSKRLFLFHTTTKKEIRKRQDKNLAGLFRFPFLD